MTIEVELFTSNICTRCAQAKTLLRELANELGDEQFELHFVDVVENLDHAVALGVLATPALAVNGELICHSLPGKRKLRELLVQQLHQQEDYRSGP